MIQEGIKKLLLAVLFVVPFICAGQIISSDKYGDFQVNLEIPNPSVYYLPLDTADTMTYGICSFDGKGCLHYSFRKGRACGIWKFVSLKNVTLLKIFFDDDAAIHTELRDSLGSEIMNIVRDNSSNILLEEMYNNSELAQVKIYRSDGHIIHVYENGKIKRTVDKTDLKHVVTDFNVSGMISSRVLNIKDEKGNWVIIYDNDK